MKITISQHVEIQGEPPIHYWSKDYETVLLPNKGIMIEDSLWKDPGSYEVCDVTVNYQENVCYVAVKQYSTKISEHEKAEFANIANLHGWKCSWE